MQLETYIVQEEGFEELGMCWDPLFGLGSQTPPELVNLLVRNLS